MKLLEKVVPLMLTIQQKLDRRLISQNNLEHFKQTKIELLRRSITMEETWIYHHDPYLEQERLRWTEAGYLALKQTSPATIIKEDYGSIAPVLKVVLTMTKFNEVKYELLEHPPYLSDLATSDYYLFRNLKQFLRGKRFSSNEEAIAAVDRYFAELPEIHYSDGIKLLEDQ
ncbi:uncharacterized protein [Bactrocera oleae]|uniref:uncharacterized protein n=1 Tax=Bactrocera oleae TaxID=104688 RepID=UPI00387E4E30